jgi:hypothetical protein
LLEELFGVKQEHQLGSMSWVRRICAVGLAVLPLSFVVPAYEAHSAGLPDSLVDSTSPSILARTLEITQDDRAADDTDVPPAQVEKYVAVYRSMQRDKTLTADQAAAKQGMTLQEFRSLENRVQRDDSALQHARDELQSAAKASPGSSGRSTTSTPGMK